VWTRTAELDETTSELVNRCNFFEHLHFLGKELIDAGIPIPNDLGIKVIQNQMALKEGVEIPVFYVVKLRPFVLGVQMVLPGDFFKQETEVSLNSLGTALFNTSIVSVADSTYHRVLQFRREINISRYREKSLKSIHIECASIEELYRLYSEL